MQIVGAIDIEAAVAAELGASMTDVTVTAYPPPDDIRPTTVSVMSLGSYEQSPVSDSYDLVAYVWASTYGDAYATALDVCREIRALRFNGGAESGATFSTSEASAPYEDPDPQRQTLKRCTVRATVGARGAGFIEQ